MPSPAQRMDLAERCSEELHFCGHALMQLSDSSDAMAFIERHFVVLRPYLETGLRASMSSLKQRLDGLNVPFDR